MSSEIIKNVIELQPGDIVGVIALENAEVRSYAFVGKVLKVELNHVTIQLDTNIETVHIEKVRFLFRDPSPIDLDKDYPYKIFLSELLEKLNTMKETAYQDMKRQSNLIKDLKTIIKEIDINEADNVSLHNTRQQLNNAFVRWKVLFDVVFEVSHYEHMPK